MLSIALALPLLLCFNSVVAEKSSLRTRVIKHNDRRLEDNPAFIEKDALVVMGAESVPTTSPWVYEKNVQGYTGKGFIRFDGNSVYGGDHVGMLSYFIQIENPGTYQMTMRLRKNNPDEGHLGNDCYVRVPGQADYKGEITKAFMRGSLPINVWRWDTKLEVDHDNGIFPIPMYDFDSPGIYELQVWGRSKNFFIDRIILFKPDTVSFDYAKALQRPESRRVGESEPGSGTDVRINKLELTTAGVANSVILGELKDGDTIDLAETGENLSIIAYANGTLAAVTFFYNGFQWIEGGAPWTMRGDKPKTGIINVVDYLKTTGEKQVIVTGEVIGGESVGDYKIDFTVVDSRGGVPAPPTTKAPVTGAPTTDAPVTLAPTSKAPVTAPPTKAPVAAPVAPPVAPPTGDGEGGGMDAFLQYIIMLILRFVFGAPDNAAP